MINDETSHLTIDVPESGNVLYIKLKMIHNEPNNI